MTTTHWPPHREPFRETFVRNIVLAAITGLVLSRATHGMVPLPLAIMLMLWPTFGGHYFEVWYLNWLRPRISPARGIQIFARITTWFIAGVEISVAMRITASLLAGLQPPGWWHWWLGGCAFIAIELIAHLAPTMRGRASFYNGHG